MRLKAGAPGIGIVESIIDEVDDYKVLMLCISPYSTKEFLTNRIGMINGLGGKMLNILKESRSVETFLDLSFRFARSIDFITDRAARVIDALHCIGCKASVALFGETVFTIVSNDKVGEVEKVLSCYRDLYSNSSSSVCYLSCSIDTRGATVIEDTREPS
jgi:pantoate kinase